MTHRIFTSRSEYKNRDEAISVDSIRSHFPALQRQLNDLPVAYFDGPGGTQVPRAVIDAMVDYLAHRQHALELSDEGRNRCDHRERAAGARKPRTTVEFQILWTIPLRSW
jgi:hypothetical protein